MSSKNLAELEVALNYMLMEELKEVCGSLNLPHAGKKGEVVRRILHFVKVGKVLGTKSLPAVSKAIRGESYPLRAETLILSGSYKNDLGTRLFMQKLVGEHFHFTAFGQDWIRGRWMAGRPPSYREFADFWQGELAARRDKRAEPKKEWAYLNFSQSYLAKVPHASRGEIVEAWKKKRLVQANKAKALLKKFSSL